MRRTAMLVAAGALTVSGCAQGSGGGTAEPLSSDDFAETATAEGPLTVMGFGTADDEIAQQRLQRAEEALGDTEVQLIEGELDMQQFLSSVASGDVPGIINADRAQIGTLASRGAVMPLTECLSQRGVDTSVFVESALAQVTFDGQVYGIPEFNTVQLTMANQELLDEAGLTVEDVNGSSWEDVTAATEQLFVEEGGRIEVIGYDSKLPEFLPLWVHANGGSMISDDGRTATLDSPEVVEALEWAVSIYDLQGGFGDVKAAREIPDFFGDTNQFATGVLGAMPMEQWYVNVLNEVSADAPMAFDTVYSRQGEPIAFANGAAWAIPVGSANPAAACTFATTMVETESWMAAAEARATAREEAGLQFTGLLTGNQEADRQIQDELVQPSGEENWDHAVEVLYAANDNTVAFPANPADAEFKQAWQDAVNRVLNGQQEPQEAMSQAQEEAQEALDERWAAWDEEQDG
ncbi:sugar ABC transporter substrate-binding protein [Ornithinimicrobium pekingense]|uniref:Sugar ABC transporter substrate-binding protein n=2 Tax=Ornithinimicrobium pekingense TaxID=384677 RepID=A0ABQ2F7I9_9MICO|nr:sugar ABC transporter substrate-binding protein [Ornithinimicrobium pekingense]